MRHNRSRPLFSSMSPLKPRVSGVWSPEILRPSELVRIAGLGEGKAPEAVAAIRKSDEEAGLPMLTYWWTAGGEGFAPRLIEARGLPAPDLFTLMLTGYIDGARPQQPAAFLPEAVQPETAAEAAAP